MIQEQSLNEEKRFIIRPFRRDELEVYFKKRYEIAQKHNPRLIKEKNDMEIDPFDRNAIHVGAFQAQKLLGCVRLVFPLHERIPLDDFQDQNYQRSLEQARIKEQLAISSLPVSLFLKGDRLRLLEDYFNSIRKAGFRYSEIGRLINFDEESKLKRHITALIRFIWALNMTLNIDYCFLNSTPRHARFYERSFDCKAILPGMLSSVEDPNQKTVLRADINYPSPNHSRQIHEIREHFETHGFGPITI